MREQIKYRLLRNYPSSLVPDANKDDGVLQMFNERSSIVCMVLEGTLEPQVVDSYFQ
jgi:hypothetical protein